VSVRRSLAARLSITIYMGIMVDRRLPCLLITGKPTDIPQDITAVTNATMAIVTTIGDPTFADRNIAAPTVTVTAMAMDTERAGTRMVEGHPVVMEAVSMVPAVGENNTSSNGRIGIQDCF
jgi:hypothetical protein